LRPGARAALLATALALGARSAAAQAWLGPYDMGREASGTSWQPDATGMEGQHFGFGAWRGMAHAFVFGVYTDQGGPRGGRQAFTTNMAMVAVGREWLGGTWALRGMGSLEPLMGRFGYRELLQTGESADGYTHLIDRQHPHDAVMELAGIYSHPLGPERSVFVYAGLPGEPALGPPAFMHRASGMAIPTAPLGHHWMDATHICYGVVTGGLTWKALKLDASTFNGREPDWYRWDIEPPRFDSFSARLTVNPSPHLSAQVGAGHLKAPERLHPLVDVDRYTASVSWSGQALSVPIDLTAAWGRNVRSRLLPNCFTSAECLEHLGGAGIPYAPTRVQDALLLEATAHAGRAHLAFLRAEHVDKDELYPGYDPFHPRVFPVAGVEVGYLYDLPLRGPVGVRAGGAMGVSLVPAFIAPDYGRRPLSYWLMAQARLR
jgi:hypothetical protein